MESWLWNPLGGEMDEQHFGIKVLVKQLLHLVLI